MVIYDINSKQLCIRKSIINIGGLFTCLNAGQMIRNSIQVSWFHNYFEIKFLKEK